MYVVAIHGLQKGPEKDEAARVRALAAALKVTVHEALMRLRAPGDGPLAVAVLADRDPALQLTGRLQDAGFKTAVLTPDDMKREAAAWEIKRFGLAADGLHVETAKGDSHVVPYPEVRLMLRGIGIVRSGATETEKTRSLSIGRAVLTGGIVLSRTTRTRREVTDERREGFLNVYASDGSVFVFRESVLAYYSLGPELKPSRAANFAFLVSEVRRRCPGGLYDERLLGRAGQAALLGPTLAPEEHLDLASALLARVLLGRA
jgi:hypothetical protein